MVRIKTDKAFTVIELLVVIVIIAIVATVGILAYRGIQHNAMIAVAKNELKQADSQLNVSLVENGAYPDDLSALNDGNGLDFSNSDAIVYYTPYNDLTPKDYCLTVVLNGQPFKVSRFAAPAEGFCSDQLPDAPTISAVANSTSRITVSWGAIDGVDTYRIEYSTSSSFNSSSSIENITGTSQPVDGLSSSTTYYFRVYASNILGESSASQSASATTNTAAPTSAATINASATSTTAINVSWGTVSGATSYQLQHSTASNFSSPTTINGITATSRSVTGLSANTQYYFRLYAVNAGGSGPASNTANATTNMNPPSAPTISSTTNSATQITVSWSSVSGASSYQLQRSTASNFSSPTTINGITGTSQAVTGLAQGERYYFRLYAVNAGGNSSESNAVNSVTHINAPGAPGWGQHVVSNNRTMWWHGVGCSTGYPVYQMWIVRRNNGQEYYNTGATTATSVTRPTLPVASWDSHVRAYCQGPYNSSGWSGINTAHT